MLKGLVTVVRTNLETGESETLYENYPNKVNKRSIEQLVLSNQAVFTDSLRIAISTDVVAASFETITVDNIIAIGDTAGVAGYTYTDTVGNDIRNVIYQNRFLAPATARSFSTVAIATGTTDNNLANVTRDVWAYVAFGSPVSQSTIEQIDISYKVFWDWTSAPINLSSIYQDSIQRVFLNQQPALDYDANAILKTVYSPSNPDYALRFPAISGSEFAATLNTRTPELKLEYTAATVTFPIDSYIRGLAYGNIEVTGSGLDAFKSTAGVFEIGTTATPIGTVFGHNETTEAIFDDAGNKANSDWMPNITEVTPDSSIPSVISLLVDNSGGENVGSYLGFLAPYLGGDGSITWNQEPKILVATAKYPYFVATDDDIPYHNKWIYRWASDVQWVSGNDTTIAIWQIFPEFITTNTFDLAASNSVTRINDIATDPTNNKIYAATEEGLLEITVGGGIVQLSADRAMAVDVANGGEVFAVLITSGNVGRLASSLNATWADAHSFTGTIAWENVLFIRCDRDSTDYNLAILELAFVAPDSIAGEFGNRNNQAFAHIHWWNNVGNFASTLDLEVRSATSMYFSRFTLFPYSSSFTVDGGIWVFPKWLTNQSLTVSGGRGFPKELVRQIEALGTEIVDATGNLVNTASRVVPIRLVVGAAQFNQEIRVSTYTSTGSFTFNQGLFPSYAILDPDISGNTLSVVLGGYHGIYSASTTYVETSHLQQAGGCFDFAVNPGAPTVNGYTRYKNEPISRYTFTGIGGIADRKSSANYALGGNVVKGVNGGIYCFNDSSVTNTQIEFSGGNEFSSTNYHPITIAAWGPYNKTALHTYKGWGVRYGWNTGTTQWEASDVLGGKPLHSANETFVRGLSIGWTDLDGGAVNDLIANQHYEATRCSVGFISDGTYPSFSAQWNYFQRPVVLYNLVDTIPGGNQITLAPASSDPLWLTLDSQDGSRILIQIAGNTGLATIIYSGLPAANEILVSDPVAGTLDFNAADSGKGVTGTVLYLQQIDTTEVL